MEEEKQKAKKKFEVVKVPIEHKLAIQDPEGELMNEIQLLVKIANDLEELKKNLVG